MIIIPPGGPECQVYSMSWKKPDIGDVGHPGQTGLSYCEDGVLQQAYASECRFLDLKIEDFVFEPEGDPRFYGLTWRPLFEANIWEDLWDHDPDAIAEFRRLRKLHGHI